MSQPINSPSRRRGFTLVEVIVTMTIIGFVVVGVMPFFLANSRYLFTGEQKLLINHDIREFTNEMIENAREANYPVLYEAFYTHTRSDGTTVRRDANNNGSVNSIDRRAAGQGGEFLVFAFYEDPFFDSRFFDGDLTNNTIDTNNVRVTRLVCYWIAPNRNNSTENALYTLDTDNAKASPSAASWTTSWGQTFPIALSSTTTLESLLPPATLSAAQSSAAQIVINDMEGLGANGACFTNYLNRSILVRAKILHGNQAKRVTNTYNFTVTPRG